MRSRVGGGLEFEGWELGVGLGGFVDIGFWKGRGKKKKEKKGEEGGEEGVYSWAFDFILR